MKFRKAVRMIALLVRVQLAGVEWHHISTEKGREKERQKQIETDRQRDRETHRDTETIKSLSVHTSKNPFCDIGCYFTFSPPLRRRPASTTDIY